MELNDIYSVMDKMSQAGLTLIRIKDGDFELELQSQPAVVQSSPQTIVFSGTDGSDASLDSAIARGTSPNTDSDLAEPSAQNPQNAVPEFSSPRNELKSPIVGTFYSSASADSPPLVTVGQVVHKGDVVCIVEAMKMYNEIQSEFDGVVRRILAHDGQTVEYGQTLMIIE
jgi:acetyl-CoA carboxylase biotin carboxyl carrier protein